MAVGVWLGLAMQVLWNGSTADGSETISYQYLSPVPGSKLVSPENNIIIRYGEVLDTKSLSSIRLLVTATVSGVVEGRLRLATDERTLLFSPRLPFAPGEHVTVRLGGGTRTASHTPLPPLSFSFTVAAHSPRKQQEEQGQGLVLELEALQDKAASNDSMDPNPRGRLASACDSLATPLPNVPISDSPAPGRIYSAPLTFNSPGGHLTILDDHGQPLFFRSMSQQALDFKLQPNGLMTYATRPGNCFYALDSTYAVVDSFSTGNGYVTDFHDLQLLDNGHALLMSYDPQPVRMDTVVSGGDPNATVIGLIVQEIDAAKNVVFQWRSWDHFQITDASVSGAVDLLSNQIDYVHGNSLELDTDGHILLSSRHLNEVTKINRQTGDIIWRLGLHAANNEFSFVGDPRGFSHQHDVRRIANGHITMFDNGIFLSPFYSRVVEYQLDENSLVATQVWEYRHTPDVASAFMGNAQRLSGGNTVVGWGGWFAPNITEVRPEGTTALEFTYPVNTWSYRSFRFDWSPQLLVADADTLFFGNVELGAFVTAPLTIRNVSTEAMSIDCFALSEASFSVPDAPDVTLPPGDSLTVDVRFEPALGVAYTEQLYVQSVEGSQLIAVPLHLVGNGVYTPTGTHDLPPRRFALRQNHPNPFNPVTSISYDVPQRTHVHLAVYDANGRFVETLVEGMRDAGRHEVRWHVPQGASGVYFYRLRAGSFVESRKVVLLK
jgi:hypothetical protein